MENLPTPPEVTNKKFEIEDDYYQYAAQGKVQHESLEEAKKEYDLRNKRMNSVSGKLGEKMMAGWTLLGVICPSESCQGTPLMRHGTGPMSCVACEKEYKESSLGDLIPINTTTSTKAVEDIKRATITTPIISTTTTTTNPPPSSTPSTTADTSSFYLDMHNAPILSMDKFSVHTNDASAKISKRLMQGWALLDKCCFNAQCKGEVPLMRDLAGKVCIYCRYICKCMYVFVYT